MGLGQLRLKCGGAGTRLGRGERRGKEDRHQGRSGADGKAVPGSQNRQGALEVELAGGDEGGVRYRYIRRAAPPERDESVHPSARHDDARRRQFARRGRRVEGFGRREGHGGLRSEGEIASRQGSQDRRAPGLLFDAELVADRHALEAELLAQPTFDDSRAPRRGNPVGLEGREESPAHENGPDPAAYGPGEGSHLRLFETIDRQGDEGRRALAGRAERTEPREAPGAGADAPGGEGAGEDRAELSGSAAVLAEAVEDSGPALGVGGEIEARRQEKVHAGPSQPKTEKSARPAHGRTRAQGRQRERGRDAGRVRLTETGRPAAAQDHERRAESGLLREGASQRRQNRQQLRPAEKLAGEEKGAYARPQVIGDEGGRARFGLGLGQPLHGEAGEQHTGGEARVRRAHRPRRGPHRSDSRSLASTRARTRPAKSSSTTRSSIPQAMR